MDTRIPRAILIRMNLIVEPQPHAPLPHGEPLLPVPRFAPLGEPSRARTAGLSRKCPPHTRASLLQAAAGGPGGRRDSLRPSPPTPRTSPARTSPVRADLVIRAPSTFRPAALAECGDLVAGAVVRFLVAPCSFVRAACFVPPGWLRVPAPPPALPGLPPFLGTGPHPIRPVFVAPRVT